MDQVLSIWLEDKRKALIANYDRLGLRASGQWAESLEPFQEISDRKIKAGMLGEDYTYYLENGRGPNKDQSDDAIQAWVGWAGSTFLAKWVEDKGINASPYAIAYKIAKSGWKVPNANNAGGLVSDIINPESIEKLNRELLQKIVTSFQSDILKNFK